MAEYKSRGKTKSTASEIQCFLLADSFEIKSSFSEWGCFFFELKTIELVQFKNMSSYIFQDLSFIVPSDTGPEYL